MGNTNLASFGAELLKPSVKLDDSQFAGSPTWKVLLQMEGRCDNEPLDSADDICELCGGEYCEACLIFPRGKKHPVCKTCAIMNSGVRGGVKTERKADRRAAKKRRVNLIETKDERDSGRFVFFDEEGHDLDLPVEAQPETASEDGRRKRVTFGRRKKDDVEATVETSRDGTEAEAEAEGLTKPEVPMVAIPTRAPANTSAPTATELLARLREDDRLAKEGIPTASPAPTVTPPPTTPSSQTVDPFDQTVDPFAMNDPFAVELAAQPIVKTTPLVQQPPLAGAYLAATSHRAAPTGPQDSAIASVDPPYQPDSPAPVVAPPPSELHQPFAADREPALAAPPEVQMQPLTQRIDRPSLTTRLGDAPPVATPPSALVSDPFVDVASPAPAPITNPNPEPRPTSQLEPAGATIVRPKPTGGPMEPAPLPRYEPAAAGAAPTSSTTIKADIDEDGNWVPPALRGMAPKAVREADVLPRRRQG